MRRNAVWNLWPILNLTRVLFFVIFLRFGPHYLCKQLIVRWSSSKLDFSHSWCWTFCSKLNFNHCLCCYSIEYFGTADWYFNEAECDPRKSECYERRFRDVEISFYASQTMINRFDKPLILCITNCDQQVRFTCNFSFDTLYDYYTETNFLLFGNNPVHFG